MPKNINTLVKVSRKNREVKSEEWIKNILKTFGYGVFATTYDSQPFVNWNLFIYNEKENVIYFHTANTGRTRRNIEANPNVCFSIGSIGERVYAKKAVNFSTRYKSIVIYGKAKIIDDDKKIMEVLQSFIGKYFPELRTGDYEAFNIDDARRATVYELKVEQWSGKMNLDKSEY